MKKGDVFSTNGFGNLIVTMYGGCRDVHVMFIDTGFTTIAQSGHIYRGAVKDKLKPVCCGVGYIGDGKHKSKINGKETKAYSVWSGMITRCYSEKSLKDKPTYIDCTVCDEWMSFQSFADWFEKNYIEGFELDKGALSGKKTGNVYSPSTCCFLSHADNVEQSLSKGYTLTSPEGLTVKVRNLSKFCRENNLTQSNMAKVVTGERLTHKGWRKA